MRDNRPLRQRHFRRNRTLEYSSYYPQKKFRMRAEQAFRLQCCAALSGQSETAIIERALDDFMETHLSPSDQDRFYPDTRQMHECWIHACPTLEREQIHGAIKRELGALLERLRRERLESSSDPRRGRTALPIREHRSRLD